MIVVRRAGDRFETRANGVVSRHSFSFGEHYDPGNVGFAALVAHNDDVLGRGGGYDTHPHADTEIVTWVLEGSLVHRDSRGHHTELHPGVAQRLTAGSGVLHSERNDAGSGPTRFVQMWLRPDEPGLDPELARREVGRLGGLVPLVSGVPGLDAALSLPTSGAALHVAALAAGQSVLLPDAPRLHVFVTRGSADLERVGRLGEADAARVTDEGGPTLTAVGDAEVLVWQLDPRPFR